MRLAAANEYSTLIDHTGDIVSFTAVGPRPGRCPWICYTTNTTNVEWQFPNGTTVDEREKYYFDAARLSSGRTTQNRYALFRVPDYFSPDGVLLCEDEWQCGGREEKCDLQ